MKKIEMDSKKVENVKIGLWVVKRSALNEVNDYIQKNNREWKSEKQENQT
jgi:hypothetical protein